MLVEEQVLNEFIAALPLLVVLFEGIDKFFVVEFR